MRLLCTNKNFIFIIWSHSWNKLNAWCIQFSGDIQIVGYTYIISEQIKLKKKKNIHNSWMQILQWRRPNTNKTMPSLFLGFLIFLIDDSEPGAKWANDYFTCINIECLIWSVSGLLFHSPIHWTLPWAIARIALLHVQKNLTKEKKKLAKKCLVPCFCFVLCANADSSNVANKKSEKQNR